MSTALPASASTSASTPASASLAEWLQFKTPTDPTFLVSSQSGKLPFTCSQTQLYCPIFDRLFVADISSSSAAAANTAATTSPLSRLQLMSNQVQLTNLRMDEHVAEDELGEYVEAMCKIRNKRVCKPVFIKQAPILNPFDYLTGRYANDEPALRMLPLWNASDTARHATPATAPHYSDCKYRPMDKLHDPNNSAYTEAFFVYLQSQLKGMYQFPHSIQFFGTYGAVVKDYEVNVYDDIEHLVENPYFLKYNGKQFFVDNYDHLVIPPTHSKKHDACNEDSEQTAPLLICVEEEEVPLCMEDSDAAEVLDALAAQAGPAEQNGVEMDVADLLGPSGTGEGGEGNATESAVNALLHRNGGTLSSNKSTQSNDSYSDCSSRTSYTTVSVSNENTDLPFTSDAPAGASDAFEDGPKRVVSDAIAASKNAMHMERDERDERKESTKDADNSNGDDIEDEDGDEDDDEDDGEDDEWLSARIPTFPVQMIVMEECHQTLEDILQDADERLPEKEWLSMFMQVIMILITYQKAFDFTHNDLHTNNIMCCETDAAFLQYIYEGKTYIVPTFGRLYKIIDFGRAVYRFNGNTFCSDSYNLGGDGYGQYNMEPYYDATKPRVPNNYSFDLCRLACSLLMVVVQDPVHSRVESPVLQIVSEWCCDDDGQNMLYKSNGEERYPGFKLYKMIARKVHAHIPHRQLSRPAFAQYLLKPGAKIPKNTVVVNIDAVPRVVDRLV